MRADQGMKVQGRLQTAKTMDQEHGGYNLTFDPLTVNPLSPNVADLQHFDIVLFCGFSFCNAFRPGTELFTKSLLVVRLSQGLVKKAG